MVKMRLWAAKSLLSRYQTYKKVEIPLDDLIDALAVMISANTLWYQKRAARILLDYQFGKSEVNKMLEGQAVVLDRNDALVSGWRKAVLKRDGECKRCGSKNELQAHHISFWCDDPINRINLENGVALCSKCHSLEHPELSDLLFSGKGVNK